MGVDAGVVVRVDPEDGSPAVADTSLGLIIPDWPRHPRVRAVSTTRFGGVSPAPLDSFNLGAQVGDAPENVALNRRALARAAGLPREPAWLRQVHGRRVVRALDEPEPEADACWTNQRGVPCVVMSADCLPILLADEAGRCVAAAHAGWRGLAAGVIGAVVASLPVPVASLSAWLGPAIGPNAFEVGAEVRNAFLKLDKRLASAFVSGPGDRLYCNLYRAATLMLNRAGITQVYGGARCTFTESDAFFSHRRDGRCGRMASLIWLSNDD